MPRPVVVLLSVVAALVLGIPLLLWLLSSRTQMEWAAPVKVVGTATPVEVRLANPHGIRTVSAYLEQAGNRFPLAEKSEAPTRVWFFRKHEAPRTLNFVAGKQAAGALKDGKARLVVEARANDFGAATDTLAVDVDVNTQPPALLVDTAQHYINQGGSELVTFTVSGYWTEAGVKVGKYAFRSFPMPGTTSVEGKSSARFSLFAYPWDTPANTAPVVYARNPAGNEVTQRFWFRVFPKKFRSRELAINDQFLQRVVTQIDPQGQGDLLPRFLKINRDMRQRNNETLHNLRDQTSPQVLWQGPFLQLGNSQVEAQFADDRTYVYQGKKVDEQMHLGFDLSKVAMAPIEAANDGRVLYAGDLGIYGNCVVLDHGYGLQSIYAHMSQIAVKVGDSVKKRQVLGNSGSTGLAGGDHLHFSMQVDGVQVTPVEWWDAHWIQDRILSKLPVTSATPAQRASR